jgi:terminase, large subunit
MLNYHPALGMAALESFGAWAPPPELTLSQWAELYAYLSPESAAEPGKFHAYPYQVGIMDALTDPANEYVVVQKSARVGYTKIIGLDIAYNIHQSPCPMLCVQPTIEDAQGYSKDEIAPLFRDTPVLGPLVAESKTRDSANTILKKTYPGGSLHLVGANSARGFRRITVKKVYFDEVDAYPPGGAGSEGDQIKLGIRRTDTFWNRQIVLGSTPTLKGFSKIEAHYLATDRRVFQVPCPRCKTYQPITWKQIKWPKDNPERARLVCIECQLDIEDSQKRRLQQRGQWVATRPFARRAGFFIWAGYSLSPNASWGALATEFLESKRDPQLLQTFVNTVLAETWEEKGEGITVEAVAKRAEQYASAEVPLGVLLLTLGADVQLDRIEAELVGWGRGEETWSIDYFVIEGDPQTPTPWAELDKILTATYLRRDGLPLRIAGACIDSGYATQSVYKYCWQRRASRVWPIKGLSKPGKPIVGNPSKTKTFPGLLLYTVGTDTAKDRIYARLKITAPGPGCCHFPSRYEEEYFRQLTAEKVYRVVRRGAPRREYRQTYGRNEALDCRVYNHAALAILKPRLQRIEWKQQQYLKTMPGRKQAPEADDQKPITAHPLRKRQRRKPAEDRPKGHPRPRPKKRPGRRRPSGWIQGAQ